MIIEMKSAKFNSRSLVIDGIRGLTIILMIIFHFSFDLYNFNFLKIDIIHDPFWFAFPRLIVFLDRLLPNGPMHRSRVIRTS